MIKQGTTWNEVSASELNRLIDKIESSYRRITAQPPLEVYNAGGGLCIRLNTQEGFWANLTSQSGSTPAAYAWTEQIYIGSGLFQDKLGARIGTTTLNSAFAINENAPPALPYVVWLSPGFPSNSDNTKDWYFDLGQPASTPPPGSTISVENSVGGVIDATCEVLRMDLAGVMTATALAGSRVQFDFTAANLNQNGVVIGGAGVTGHQIWNGFKSFSDFLYVLNSQGITFLPGADIFGGPTNPASQVWQLFPTVLGVGTTRFSISQATGYGLTMEFTGGALRHKFGLGNAQPTSPQPVYAIEDNTGSVFDGAYGINGAGDTVTGGLITTIGANGLTLVNGNATVIDTAMRNLKGDTGDIITFTNLSANHDQIVVADASITQVGVVNLTTQSFLGGKTFTNGLAISSGYAIFFGALGAYSEGIISGNTTTVAVGCGTGQSLLVGQNSGNTKAILNSSSGQAFFGIDNGSGEITGKYGTDPVGNVITGGVVTTVGSGGLTTTINYLKSPSGSGTLSFVKGVLTGST